jgi:Ca-activated chloride channel family protein
MLRESTAATRIVILLTDGEHNAPSIEPLEAANLAQALRIRVYTIGVVETGGRTTGLDERLLTEIAEGTGGKFYTVEDPQALASVYEEIGNLEKSGVGRERFERFTQLAIWFLVPAAALLALDLVLGATWLRRSPA